jgi:3-deoxy-7-phosphoheptulonate synthase
MLIILRPNMDEESVEFKETWKYLSDIPDIQIKKRLITGEQQTLTEIYLIGDTSRIDRRQIAVLPAVERVIKISVGYRIIGRHKDSNRAVGFDYNGIHFSQDSLHVFAGLCAVDSREHTERMMKALQENGQSCTRMGAYKPRTNPYSFQGRGKSCLSYIFELAGKYDIKVIAMEVTHEKHIEEISSSLEESGHPTGVILQIGTRNAQNFELLKTIGRQGEFPALLKRGFGITLSESLNAAEYLASEGNTNIIFCLRGMKTSFGNPHRNFVDFSHVPVVKRLTRMPVCIDPSHSVGSREAAPDGLMDLFHTTAQGIIAGANMVLVDFHPEPRKALVDGPQALYLDELPIFLEDIRVTRDAYKKRSQLAKQLLPHEAISPSSG